MKSIHPIFPLLLVLILCIPLRTPAKVVYVAQDASGSRTGEDWQNAFTTIIAGLTASASGDEVWGKRFFSWDPFARDHAIRET